MAGNILWQRPATRQHSLLHLSGGEAPCQFPLGQLDLLTRIAMQSELVSLWQRGDARPAALRHEALKHLGLDATW